VSAVIRIFTFCLLAGAALAANTQISTEKPIINFSLPLFNAANYRSWLIRGSEAMFAPNNRIEIKDLTLTIFTGNADEKVDTLILSPAAVISRSDWVASGPSTIRVISDQFEASGSQWSCARQDKKVSIAKHVRVTFRAEFKDFLK
jgi:hypothetical protein